MSRFRSFNDSGTQDAAIDVSPLMDCVFILLIFFIVTTTFVEETGVEVDKPLAASAERLAKNSVLIAVTSGGSVVYGGREVGVGGVRALVTRLLAKERLPVIIQIDRNTPSGLLVRVLGEVKLAGAEKVSIATQREQP
ncbi:MAG: biopolymer transporter ExbD [Kiritimatiellia bacterium]